jgi:signal transduction histidine kinase
VSDGCFGLKGIQERARLLGGVAKIDAAAGEGTRIAVELPIVEPEASDRG